MKNLFSLKPYLLLVFTCFLMCQAENKSADHTDSGCQVLSLEDFEKELKAAAGAQLIDVRTPKEFAKGAIEGAKNIDYYRDDFLEQMTNELDKNKTVFVYCKSGGRSGKTCNKLLESGFQKVYDLKGGYLAWATQHKK